MQIESTSRRVKEYFLKTRANTTHCPLFILCVCIWLRAYKRRESAHLEILMKWENSFRKTIFSKPGQVTIHEGRKITKAKNYP
jgi:hypothetical protein